MHFIFKSLLLLQQKINYVFCPNLKNKRRNILVLESRGGVQSNLWAEIQALVHAQYWSLDMVVVSNELSS